jgi:alpha-tubulin suppressor-like RCC1 family protein
VGSTTCALLDNNKVKCWGANWYGILGIGDGNTRGDGAGEMGDALPYVDLGTGRTAVAISVGHMAACALRDDGKLVCWGNSDFGTLGTHSTLPRGDGPGEMGDALVPVILNSTVALATAPTTISAGAHTVCAVFTTGELKCWGKNTDGMCGVGSATPIGDTAPEMTNLAFVDLGTE